MTRRILICLITMLLSITNLAHADLDAYITDLNISARADLGEYKARLGAWFEISNAEINIVLSSVDSPAEAALVFWLGEKCRKPVDKVLQVYQVQKSQGWGNIAKSLGIKPGSSDFHALKNGDLSFRASNYAEGKSSKNKGNGKNKYK